ncbi:hypothetical protein [Umezawaea tangerina]|uniref:Uncharacterized protein n=1 Tax=Umezawaea tangerina TaxID=84725 RepID=A0A2T0TAV0_9PSEU|nr:hypothetical protein [Umezawaea tangerina]PRY42787.1 hypothetical protein CLV43_104624 [Umezawaea tangerina]
MAAETDPKLIEEIDAIVPAGTEGDETPLPVPPKPETPAEPNGGPYHSESNPVGAN